MAIPKAQIFVDGENITMRYQAMLDEGFVPKKDVIHYRDIFVWHPEITQWSMLDIIRVSYYTSVVGDELKIAKIMNKISNVGYKFTYESGDTLPGEHSICPHIYKKSKKAIKTRLVDINIIIDVMRCAFSDNVDLIYLISGDGDYLKLLEEVGRKNKTIYLSAFTSGFNQDLYPLVDVWRDLDDIFFIK